MQCDNNDARAHDLSGRIRYLETVVNDADQISRVLQKFATEKSRSDPALSGYLHRLAKENPPRRLLK